MHTRTTVCLKMPAQTENERKKKTDMHVQCVNKCPSLRELTARKRERARECARGRAKDITGHGVRDADVSVNSALLTTVTVGLSLVCC